MAVLTTGKLDESFTATATGADTMAVGGKFTASVDGTFGGSVFLERDIRGDGNYSTVYEWTAAEDRNGEEIAAGITYRWRSTVSSGTAVASLRAGPVTLR
jgi:hypothetical protein